MSPLEWRFDLVLDDLFHGASTFAAPYRAWMFGFVATALEVLGEREKSWAGRRMAGGWFADMVGLWTGMNGVLIPLSRGQRRTTTGHDKSGVTQRKTTRSHFYFLDAFKRFETMTPEQVRNVAFEIALLGTRLRIA
jgi:hypothetical protein